jgi:hypothetical protein
MKTGNIFVNFFINNHSYNYLSSSSYLWSGKWYAYVAIWTHNAKENTDRQNVKLHNL